MPVTQGLFLGVAFVWLLNQLPEPFTLLRSAVTPVLIVAAVTCLYIVVSISLLGDSTSSYKWQLSSIFGIVFACLSFAFLLENTDELLDIPLYQGLDEEFTRRFNLPVLPGEDDEDTTEFDRRHLLARVILALFTGLLAFCHFSMSVRRAVYHHRLVHSQFHGKFFKYVPHSPRVTLTDRCHSEPWNISISRCCRCSSCSGSVPRLNSRKNICTCKSCCLTWKYPCSLCRRDQTVDDTCQQWLGATKVGALVCRTLAWTGLGARDLYHTLRWSVHGGVVALSLLLFRPLLSAHTHRVAAVMKGLLMMQGLYSAANNSSSLGALMQQEALSTMRSLGIACTELSALPLLLMTWQWHYHAHWLVDYLALVSLLAHWIALVLAFAALHLGTDAHRPGFFDTLLRWWDRRSATTPRNNSSKKLRAAKKKNM